MIAEVVQSFLGDHPADLHLFDGLRDEPLLGARGVIGLHKLGEEGILATFEFGGSTLQLRHQGKAFVVERASILGETDEDGHVGIVRVHVGLLRGDLEPVLVIEEREPDF